MSERLALKKNLRGVQCILCKMDRTVLMEIFITNPLSALPCPIIQYLNVPKDTSDIAEHILKEASHRENLSFALLVE